ncbi:MAG: hypothetical protein KDK91_00075, partial [Gammaproteobacteria bacterium]|nr:hypothetical protein [Gammaproteobacteria bacterium]
MRDRIDALARLAEDAAQLDRFALADVALLMREACARVGLGNGAGPPAVTAQTSSDDGEFERWRDALRRYLSCGDTAAGAPDGVVALSGRLDHSIADLLEPLRAAAVLDDQEQGLLADMLRDEARRLAREPADPDADWSKTANGAPAASASPPA